MHLCADPSHTTLKLIHSLLSVSYATIRFHVERNRTGLQLPVFIKFE